jgi:3'(2'), 5'-bisphosphate nucleotidase
MEDIQIKSELIEQLIEISKDAGKAILEVYNSNFGHQIKEDLSPLTKADTLSNNIICERLKVITPDIPILSEENSDIPFNIRSSWEQYWLVDPLDGTKEFIKKNGEFTVNIALIENNTPIFGIIHVPVTNETYWGSNTKGSFYIKGNNQKTKLCVEKNIRSQVRIVASRSHPSKMLDALLEEIGEYKIITKGSSLKFCLIAKGQADIYPRLGPTSEWDIAAGHAIVKFAGGSLLTIDRKSMQYNLTENNLNPYFVVASREDLALNAISLIT